MKNTLLSAVFIASLLSSAAMAQDSGLDVYPTPAPHAIIYDFDTGEVLFEKDARLPMEPASMTKIMTASVVFDRIKSGALSLDDEFEVSEDAWRRGGTSSGGSTMFLAVHSKVSVRDLLHGVIIQSGNDACIVLAEGIAGSEEAFSDLMNEKARALGLDSANFKNATGWPDQEHVISAKDLAKLASYTISNYPKMYEIYDDKDFTWNGVKQLNRNPLIGAGFPGADGLKTGHTESAKYGLVGSAVQNGKRRVIVINGVETSRARRAEALRMMRSAFAEFKSYKLYSAGETIDAAPVFMGKSETVGLISKEDVFSGLHRGQRKGLSAQVRYDGPIPAPITKGDHIADLVVSAPGKDEKVIPLLAANDVARKSAFGRIISALVMKIRGEA